MIDEETIKKDYVDQATAAKMLAVTQGRISRLCSEKRFEGAMKIGWSWIIPKTAIDNFQRLKRGPKPKENSQQNSDKTIINNALKEAAKWRNSEQK